MSFVNRMARGKNRLSVRVDPELIAAGRTAVAAGRAATLGAWVSEALRRQAAHDERLAAMGEFLAEDEAEHGPITDEQIEENRRWLEERSIRFDEHGEIAYRGPKVPKKT
ncbi:hypothetical protein [Patulibacter defluvii]|uniref:hypothetical protein n=1 Tax=Patulibacter defluvii TaxID=3095358 RepID=UPI002A75E97F|nr:hypothetical protein [Patulibacter sp. DM4]